MKKNKENIINRIMHGIHEFFTEDVKDESQAGEDISVKALVFIFVAGFAIVLLLYFLFGSSKAEAPGTYSEEIKSASEQEIACQNALAEQERIEEQLNSVTEEFDRVVELNAVLQAKLQNLEAEIHPLDYVSYGCPDCYVRLSEENATLKIQYVIPHNKNWLQVTLHKIKERIFGVPVDYGWVYLHKYLPNVDYSNYSAIKLFFKSDIPGGSFEVHFMEQDGDEWYYFDNSTLSMGNWVSIRIPFARFYQPVWASKGDGIQERTSVTDFGLTLTSYDVPLNKTVYMAIDNNEILSLS
jgi:hypothetical protein